VLWTPQCGTMIELKQIIIFGLISGGIYALLAVGFSLIFGVARIINLSHTAFYMLAGYLIYIFATTLGLNLYAAIVLSILVASLIGVLGYRFLIDPIRRHETAILIVTLALAIIVQEALSQGFGDDRLTVPRMIDGYVQIFGIKVFNQRILALGVAILMLAGTWLLLMRTKLGTAIRATAQDREVANLMGMNVGRMETIAMGASIALAAIAGALVAPTFSLVPHMWMSPLVMVLAVVVLGGLGSIKGSLLGAFILGFTESAVVFLAPSGSFLKEAAALTIMLIVILVRPEGLFGVSFEEER